MKNPSLPVPAEQQLNPEDDLILLELDERLEFSIAAITAELNGGCNSSKCTQNGSCGKAG